jgi:hypothetical protein
MVSGVAVIDISASFGRRMIAVVIRLLPSQISMFSIAARPENADFCNHGIVANRREPKNDILTALIV